MVQSKSGLETDWNDVDLKNAAHKHNDMRDFYSYRKPFILVISAEGSSKICWHVFSFSRNCVVLYQENESYHESFWGIIRDPATCFTS